MISSYDPLACTGLIVDDDWVSYPFVGAILADGFGDPYPGRRVLFEAFCGEAVAVSPAGDAPAGTAAPPAPADGVQQGMIASYDPKTGQGQILGDDGAYYGFVGAVAEGLPALYAGLRVEFESFCGDVVSLTAPGAAQPVAEPVPDATPEEPPSGPRQGLISAYDPERFAGEVVDEDWNSYAFVAASVEGELAALAPGLPVAFEVFCGEALSVRLLSAEAEADPTPEDGIKQGMVASYNPETGLGQILGDDCAYYGFTGAVAESLPALYGGLRVEFESFCGDVVSLTTPGAAQPAAEPVVDAAPEAAPEEPPSGPRQGLISAYDPERFAGEVVDEDWNSYAFVAASVEGELAALAPGLPVAFEVFCGEALSVRLLSAEAEADPTPEDGIKQGMVASYNPETGLGQILGDDCLYYGFTGAVAESLPALYGGLRVEFESFCGDVVSLTAPGVLPPLPAYVYRDDGSVAALANSASPPIGQPRPMRGMVATFDDRTGEGRIVGDDSGRYVFFLGGLDGGLKTVFAGQHVAFMGSDGVATAVTNPSH